MLKTEGVEFIYSVVAQHKLEGFLGPVGEETGGVSNHHTPDGLVQGQGVGGHGMGRWCCDALIVRCIVWLSLA